jgi:hypothetical protein
MENKRLRQIKGTVANTKFMRRAAKYTWKEPRRYESINPLPYVTQQNAVKLNTALNLHNGPVMETEKKDGNKKYLKNLNGTAKNLRAYLF